MHLLQFRPVQSFLRAACLLPLLWLTACDRPAATPGTASPLTSLLEARRGFTTRLLERENTDEDVAEPPAGTFDLIKYPSRAGDLAAYVSHAPADNARHPAIVWLFGGFSNSVGEEAWTPGPPENDQSASAFREAGVLMMYPSLRGGNRNPGHIENFYGEVDDVLAARDWLAKQPFVDPARIYLGGHSTGGTLALLVAECGGQRFRGVFAFGPAGNPRDYGDEVLFYDVKNPRESELRAPERWLAAVDNPTFVLEGTGPRSNIDSLQDLAKRSKNPLLHFLPIKGASHFSGLRPVSRLLARKILADTGPAASLTLTEGELADAMHQP